MKRLNNRQHYTCIFFFFVCLTVVVPLKIASGGESLSPPKVMGITNGSIYTDFVKPIWYEPSATATLKMNNGEPKPHLNGSEISANGEYQLIVTASSNEVSAETVINFTIDTDAETAIINTNIEQTGTKLTIRYHPTYQNDSDINPLMAIWTEDKSGKFLQNLYVSAVPATNIMRYYGNKVERPETLPYWLHKACVKKNYSGEYLYLSDPETPIPDDLDAVSGATQKTGFILKTKATDTVGTIRVCFELNQSRDEGWYFNNDNDIFSDNEHFTDSQEPAIVYTVDINTGVSGTYLLGGSDGKNTKLPTGYSHYAGETGILYTDFYADDNGMQRYKFDNAHLMVEQITIEVEAQKGHKGNPSDPNDQTPDGAYESDLFSDGNDDGGSCFIMSAG